MRVLALTRYGPAGPSSRYRYYQYLPYLKKEGFDISVSPFFNKKYIYNLYSDHHTINFINPFTAYMKRTSELLFHRSYDLVWMEKEAIPWIPAYLEKFLYNNSVPFVIDYDDAIYHRYDQHRNRLVRFFLSTKIEKIMSSSTVVVAGNKYIADYALKAGAPRVEIFPTVVDLSKYKVKKNINPSSFTIGWIGSPSTSRHINIASEALNKLCKIKYAEFVAIGALEQDLTKIPGKLIPWDEQTENRELTRFDVGIMPLPDTPWERGKCGFKLIQYMGSGLPVIASPVGVNNEIVDHGVNGFLARDTREWMNYFQILIKDPDLCRQMGARGRKKVEEQYSLEVVAPKLVSILKEAARA